MLRGNLSTRPFYNDRIVTLGILVLAVVVLALTAFNVMRLASLSARRTEIETRLADTRNESATVRSETDDLRQGVDQVALSTLAISTSEANDLIEQRTFSWTALFGLLETAMPPDVRLVSVSPSVDNTELKVSMTIVAREFTDVDTFLDALLDTGAFYDATPTEMQEREDGTYTASIDAAYLGAGVPDAAAAQAGEVAP